MISPSFCLLAALLVSMARHSSAFVMPVNKIVSRPSIVPVNAMPEFSTGFLDSVSTLMTADVLDVPEAGGVSYSRASYYTILGLYLLSFPGLWSTIKRSTKAKIKRTTYVAPGENVEGGKGLRQQAGEIMAYMKANNYEVVEAGETIKFRGIVQRSTSQAFFLVFCTALAFLSLGLVLQIQFQGLELPVIGEPNWYLLSLLSPYAGLYYWKQGDRVDDCEVKLEANDDETENEITVQGSDEEMERMWRTLEWQEKGMVKIEGLLEG
ncbi:Protein of unknown function (DUF3529) [Seminavis robusta]|uniref:Uncharacterized protein n=1 Tax=Seminavis robusta TaxID=568900 RepID=A0A9N8H2V9_9STRA|nr:Protein of unknown function (DUF3529) [Seminavis robusta]|eukprot:Sro15_g011380.1 Protein of unknown function (DUF3529) (266) ;mRNA; r:160589-161706